MSKLSKYRSHKVKSDSNNGSNKTKSKINDNKNNQDNIIHNTGINNNNNNTIAKSFAILDSINIELTKELLKNPDVKSSDISDKLNVPLSTIQRRRARIEKSLLTQKRYEIDCKQFGFRIADLMVNVSQGDFEEIAKEIVNQNRKNVLEVSIRIGNPDVNLVATVIYRDSDEVFDIMHNFRKMQYVEKVEWSEIVKTVIKNEEGIVDNLFSNAIFSNRPILKIK